MYVGEKTPKRDEKCEKIPVQTVLRFPKNLGMRGVPMLEFRTAVRPLLSLRLYSLSNNHQLCRKFTRKSNAYPRNMRGCTNELRSPNSCDVMCPSVLVMKDSGFSERDAQR